MRSALTAICALALALVLVVVAARAGSVPQKANAPRSASVVYAKYCASCHGKDGRARTFKAKFNHARDLTDSQWHESVSDARIYNSIMNGRGKMPAFSKKMSAAEIEQLAALVRTFRTQPNAASRLLSYIY